MIENILEHLLIENVYDFLIGKDKAVKDAVLSLLSQDDIMDLLHISLERRSVLVNTGGHIATQGYSTTASSVTTEASVAGIVTLADGYVRPSVASEVASTSISPSSGGL